MQANLHSSRAVIFVPIFTTMLSCHRIDYTRRINIMKNGALYIRGSTDRQEELSPDAQKRLMLDFAHDNDIIITEDSIYWEIGISGRSADKRPSFRQMIAAAKSPEHPYDVILVWKFSRFARNQEESIVYKSLLKKAGVEVISISEPLPDGIMGGLIERILEWMDEYYSIRLSGEVMRGMTEKALRGGYQANPPLGYNRERNQTPTVNEAEAALVRMIFRMFTEEHLSISAIAKKLNLAKYPTKRGAHWNVTHLRYLLGNPFYIGKVRWNYVSHGKGKRLNDSSEWIIADGVHEALITEETFEKAAILLKRSATTGWVHGHMPAKHWISGVLKCASCGGAMTYSSETKRNKAAYRCHNHIAGTCPVTNRILVSKLEPAILEGLETFMNTNHFEYIRKITQETSADTASILKEQLLDLQKKEKRVRKAYLDGIDTLDEYRESRQAITRQKEELTIKLEAIHSPSSTITEQDRLQMADNIQDVLLILRSKDADMIKKADAIRSICEKITYDKSKNQLWFHFIL